MQFDSIKEATMAWVNGFNYIPRSLLLKLLEYDAKEVYEITPPSMGNRVYIYRGDREGSYGQVVGTCFHGEEDMYIIEVDGDGEKVPVCCCDFEVEYDGELPISGLWTFKSNADELWARGGCGYRSHLQEMADCGFRIYEQDELGLLFGIDGFGYDFYASHWIPLYVARGLQWHNEGMMEYGT